MNITRFLSAVAFAFALLASPAFAGDKHAACCEKAKTGGKDCEHKCCVEAKKTSTVCEKCGGKAEEKKAS
jgi:hypothetical protein